MRKSKRDIEEANRLAWVHGIPLSTGAAFDRAHPTKLAVRQPVARPFQGVGVSAAKEEDETGEAG